MIKTFKEKLRNTGKRKSLIGVIKKNQKAFTLVEILVAVGIFAVIVMLSLGALANIFDANRKSQSLKAIMTNLNFAVEIMTREMRFGTNYHCGTSGTLTLPQNCTSGDNFFSFLSSGGNQFVYRLNQSTNQLEKSDDGGNTYLGITAPEITIQALSFYVIGAGQGASAGNQPKVIILIRGYAGTKATSQSSFSLETTVSQRVLDVQ
ncbi:MAG: type II secretion system protein [Minisyncoccia bacterium]